MKNEPFKQLLFIFVVLFAVPSMIGSGCSTDADLKDDIEDGPVPFEILKGSLSPTEYVNLCFLNFENIEDTTTNIDEGLSGIELIIDSQTELNTYIICVDTVSINFEQEFLLGGITNWNTTTLRVGDQNLELSNDTLYYQVGIINRIGHSPTRGQYLIKVLSRDYLEYPVVFDIYWDEY
ncbi:MAG: hypothetical protein WD022_04765 [Balneolaceae bacterium]